MAQVCREVTEWIEEEVVKPVEEWVKRTEEKCKKRPWWHPLRWFCWLVTTLVKVVIWVVVTVGKWVTRTVCEVISTIIDAVVAISVGLYNIIIGIFTWDWARVWDGLVGVGTGIVGFVLGIARVILLGDTIDFIRDDVNTARLRSYVGDLLEKKYKGKQLEAIKDALGVDHGVFGFRIAAKALRTYVKSDYKSNLTNPPDLILWYEDPSLRINLKELAGFEYSEFWRRFRPEVVSESGSFSEEDLDEYISSRGAKGKVFSVFCMDKGTLQTKLDTASEKGRELGLMFKWKVKDVQVTMPDHVRHNGFDTDVATQSLIDFLVDIAGRRRKSQDPDGAQKDLCNVPAAGVFWYTDKLNGLSVHLYDSQCLDGSIFEGGDTSGVSFKDRIPDFIWKYVPIHEIGHYFGLCHADGLDRIMFNAKDNLWWKSWSLLPEYLYLSGSPGFTFDEAKKAWDYIVEHFSASCLVARAE